MKLTSNETPRVGRIHIGLNIIKHLERRHIIGKPYIISQDIVIQLTDRFKSREFSKLFPRQYHLHINPSINTKTCITKLPKIVNIGLEDAKQIDNYI